MVVVPGTEHGPKETFSLGPCRATRGRWGATT
jgi:hypothetical protein